MFLLKTATNVRKQVLNCVGILAEQTIQTDESSNGFAKITNTDKTQDPTATQHEQIHNTLHTTLASSSHNYY